MDTSLLRPDARSLLSAITGGSVASVDDPSNIIRERYNLLKSSYEQRLKSLVGQLKDTLLRVQGDAAVNALAADTSTADFVPARVDEVIEAALTSEREATITRLSEMLATRESELRALQRLAATREAAYEDKIASLQSLLSNQQLQLESRESQLRHERERDTQHTTTAASALATAQAAKDQARLLAEQRLSQLHAAEIARTTAEAAVAALQLQSEELEQRLKAVLTSNDEQQREISSLRAAVTAAANEIATRREKEGRARNEADMLRVETESVKQAHLMAERRAADADALRQHVQQLESALLTAREELASTKDQMTAAIHTAANSAARVSEMQASLGRVTAEKQGVDQERIALTQQLTSLQLSIAEHEAQSADRLRQVQESQRAMLHAEAMARASQDAVAAAEKQIVTLQSDVHMQREALERAVSDAGHYADEIGKLVNAKERATAHIQTLEREQQQVRDALQNLKAEYTEAVNGYEKAQARLRQDVEEARRQHTAAVEAADAQDVANRNHIDELSQQLSNSKMEFEGAKKQLATCQAQYSELIERYATLQAELEGTRTHLDELGAEHETLARDHEDAREELRRTTEQLSKASQTNVDLRRKVDAANEKTAELHALIEETSSQHSQLREKYQQMVKDAAELRSQNSFLRNSLEAEKAEVEAHASLSGAHEAEIARVRKDNEEVRAQLRQLQQRLAKTETQLQDAHYQLEQKLTELATMGEEHSRTTAEVSSLQLQRDRLVAEAKEKRNLESRLVEAEAERQQAADSARRAQEEVQQTRTQVQQANQHIEELETQLHLWVENVAVKFEAATSPAEIARTITSTAEQYRHQLADAHAIIQQHEAEIQTMREKSFELQSLLEATGNRIKDIEQLESDQQYNTVKLAELQARLHAAEEQGRTKTKHLEQQVQHAEDRAASLLADTARLRDDREQAMKAAKKALRAAATAESSLAALLTMLLSAVNSLEGSLPNESSRIRALVELLRGGATSAQHAFAEVAQGNTAASLARAQATGLKGEGKAIIDTTFASTSIGSDTDSVPAQDTAVPRVVRVSSHIGGLGAESPPRRPPPSFAGAGTPGTQLSSIMGTPTSLLRSPRLDHPAEKVVAAAQARLQSSLTQVGDALTKLVRQATALEEAHTSNVVAQQTGDALRAKAEGIRVAASRGSSASAEDVSALDETLRGTHEKLLEIERQALDKQISAAAAVSAAEDRVRSALLMAEHSGLQAVNDVLAMVSELSTSHGSEVAELQEIIERQKEIIIDLEIQIRKQQSTNNIKLTQLNSSTAESIAVACEEVRRSADAEWSRRCLDAEAKAEKANGKLRALRQELLRMAQEADKKISDESAKRAQAETRVEQLHAELKVANRRLESLQRKITELTEALRITTTTLKLAEEKRHDVSSVSGAHEQEATRLKQIVDRALHHLQSPLRPGLGEETVSSDPLNDSLVSAAKLNDVTQRLSAYVRTGRRNRRRSTSSSSTTDTSGSIPA